MTERDTTIEILRDAPFFRDLGADELRALGYVLREVVVEDGDMLFAEGDAGAEAFVVLEGSIEIVQRLADGRLRVRREVVPGELFGELALFRGGRRAAGARALGRTRLGAIERERLVALIGAWPTIAMALLSMEAERFVALEREYRAARGDDEQTER